MKDFEETIQPEGEIAPADEPKAQEEQSADQEPDELSALKKKYDEVNDRYLRLMAEYDNFRKRTQREKEGIYADATANAVERLLPTLDSFERACVYETGSDEFKKGFDMIYSGFRAEMTALGVEAYGEVGDVFDPTLHNAVSHIEDERLGANVLSQVMQKGYRLGGRIIRYAMVQTAN